MEDRFTPLALKMIKNAIQLSKDMGHGSASSGHLLLAIKQDSIASSYTHHFNEAPTKAILDGLDTIAASKSDEEKKNTGMEDDLRMLMTSALKIATTTPNPNGGIGTITVEILFMCMLEEHNTSLVAQRLIRAASGLGDEYIMQLATRTRQSFILHSRDANYREDEPEDMTSGSTGMARVNSETAPARRGGKKTMLDEFAINLTQKAVDNKLTPVIGRDKEIARALQVLARRTKSNPVLVGEPGVGKTAIAEGIAIALATDNSIPEALVGRPLYSVEMGNMVAGTRFRGDFEERIVKLIKEAQEQNAILFFDEIHTVVSAGGAEGSVNAGNILKPALARGEIVAIGATTEDEYKKHFEKDAALARRFQRLTVNEPTVEQAIQILTQLAPYYEKHHNVTYTHDSIVAAVQMSHRYQSNLFLPDKAIDLMDEAGSHASINALAEVPAIVLDLQTELRDLQEQRAVIQEENDKSTVLDQKINTTEQKISDAIEAHEKNPSLITDASIARILQNITGIPVKFDRSESRRFLSMERELRADVIGQQNAITSVSKSIRRQRAGLKDPNRPAGSFIFAGPTGVGKTELAKALAKFLFQDENALITLDMSEYAEKSSVSRLYGAAPGFIGYEEGGQLTERVRLRPYSVVLLDEIEKAHPDVFNSFLQLLEEGRLTDGQGRIVDFKNTIIIMTTNIGAAKLQAGSAGFQILENGKLRYEDMKTKVMAELKKEMKPEFLNRVDDIIVFPHLSKDELKQIVNVFSQKIASRLNNQGVKLELTDAAVDHIITIDADEKLGARPLRRAMQNTIEDSLSELILAGELDSATTVTVDFVNGELVYNGDSADTINEKLLALA